MTVSLGSFRSISVVGWCELAALRQYHALNCGSGPAGKADAIGSWREEIKAKDSV